MADELSSTIFGTDISLQRFRILASACWHNWPRLDCKRFGRRLFPPCRSISSTWTTTAVRAVAPYLEGLATSNFPPLVPLVHSFFAHAPICDRTTYGSRSMWKGVDGLLQSEQVTRSPRIPKPAHCQREIAQAVARNLHLQPAHETRIQLPKARGWDSWRYAQWRKSNKNVMPFKPSTVFLSGTSWTKTHGLLSSLIWILT